MKKKPHFVPSLAMLRRTILSHALQTSKVYNAFEINKRLGWISSRLEMNNQQRHGCNKIRSTSVKPLPPLAALQIKLYEG
jgi:hypothetical protein